MSALVIVARSSFYRLVRETCEWNTCALILSKDIRRGLADMAFVIERPFSCPYIFRSSASSGPRLYLLRARMLDHLDFQWLDGSEGNLVSSWPLFCYEKYNGAQGRHLIQAENVDWRLLSSSIVIIQLYSYNVSLPSYLLISCRHRHRHRYKTNLPIAMFSILQQVLRMQLPNWTSVV